METDNTSFDNWLSDEIDNYKNDFGNEILKSVQLDGDTIFRTAKYVNQLNYNVINEANKFIFYKCPNCFEIALLKGKTERYSYLGSFYRTDVLEKCCLCKYEMTDMIVEQIIDAAELMKESVNWIESFGYFIKRNDDDTYYTEYCPKCGEKTYLIGHYQVEHKPGSHYTEEYYKCCFNHDCCYINQYGEEYFDSYCD